MRVLRKMIKQILQNQLPDIILIFISGYTKYITSALHLHTFQFLLKPLDAQLFQEEFRRCVAQYRSAHDIFQIPQNREIIEVEMKDIVYELILCPLLHLKKISMILFLRMLFASSADREREQFLRTGVSQLYHLILPRMISFRFRKTEKSLKWK